MKDPMKADTLNKSVRLGLILFLVIFMSMANPSSLSSNEDPTVKLTPEQQAWDKIKKGALIIDVRTPAEYREGHIKGAVNIPYDQIRSRISELGNDKNRDIVLYCRSGRRSGIAKKILEKIGFKNVLNAGGYKSILKAKR